MNNAVYEKLIKLCADICRRNGKNKVVWMGSKSASLSYEPKSNEMVLTAHRFFANKSYPTTGAYTGKGTFTIVEEKAGAGSKKGWGKLKSGAGWVSLDYCIKL